MSLEKVITVSLNSAFKDPEYDIKELTQLAEAAQCEVVLEVTSSNNRIQPSLYIGSGKAEEVAKLAHDLNVKTLIFNHELTGSQMRNLEKITNCKIVDRTNLILDIFALRAHTKEAKLQVKLAQLQYRLPRLSGYGNYLSRQGGGIGTRGPGEQQLETDRRTIRREISNIKKQLSEVTKTREVTRQNRKKNQRPVIALVGYTNAGKSTIGNKLLKNDEVDEFVVKNRLFQTLDATTRIGTFNNGEEYLIIDTVGFVKNLPTHLIEAFKSTLEEVVYADIILHVVDSSSIDMEEQIKTTEKILKELGAEEKKQLLVLNKKDLADDFILDYKYSSFYEYIEISALDNNDIIKLKDKMQSMLNDKHKHITLKFMDKEMSIMSKLLDQYSPDSIEYFDGGALITVCVDPIDYTRYHNYIVEEYNE